jgi:hypothetical protein
VYICGLIVADCFAVVGRREKCHDIQVIPPPASRDLLADCIPAVLRVGRECLLAQTRILPGIVGVTCVHASQPADASTVTGSNGLSCGVRRVSHDPTRW